MTPREASAEQGAAMTPREAGAELEFVLDFLKIKRGDAQNPRTDLALIMAKQALDILATLEERIGFRDLVIEHRPADWCVTLGTNTHLGSDLTDALGQLCQTLALE